MPQRYVLIGKNSEYFARLYFSPYPKGQEALLANWLVLCASAGKNLAGLGKKDPARHSQAKRIDRWQNNG